MKIVIDAGHGLNTQGKRVPDNSMHEWEFNNVVALKVGALLDELEGVSHIFTHDTTGKKDIPLDDRTDKANAWKADVLVSIHANASGDCWSTAHGIETEIYTSVKTNSETYELAENVQTELIKATGLTNRGVKRADLHMVRETHMPAILCENGFMTNKDEAALLKSDVYRQKIAGAIVAGLMKHYKLKKKTSHKTVSKDSSETHTIEKGDTLWGLARKYKTTVDKVKSLNPKVNPDKLQIGQSLRVK